MQHGTEYADPTEVLASRGNRFLGALVDGVIALVILLPVMFYLGIFENFGKQDPQAAQLGLRETLILAGVSWGSFIVINGYLLAKRGQTVGKMVVGTRIVGFESGEIVSLWKVLGLRYVLWGLVGQIPVAGGFLGLANILFIFGDARRCLHDYTAGTHVLRADVALPALRVRPDHLGGGDDGVPPLPGSPDGP